MSTAMLFNVPRDTRGFADWSFANADSHRLIVAALQRRAAPPHLSQYVLDPMPQQDFPGFLLRHQIMHNEMDAFLKIGGSDYTAIDFRNPERLAYVWELHANEHLQAHDRLGIS